MAERFEHLENALCEELKKLDKKYSADLEMEETDVKRADLLYHALKCAETYHAMKDAEEDDDEGYSGEGGRRGGRSNRGGNRNGGSYAPRRVAYPLRYPVREMAGGYSGGYPMEMIDPYWDRRF